MASDKPAPRRGSRPARLAILAAVVGVAVIAGVAIGFSGDGSGGGGGSAGGGSFGQGEVVPADVTLEGFDGSAVSFGDLRGKPVVVNFWASWCPTCVAEMPDFEEVHQEVGDEVRFLGIDQQDTRSAALRLAEQTGVTYELVDDPNGAIFRAFGSFTMPTTVFIDAEGRVVERHNGALDAGSLREKIAELTSAQ